ncbi:MAG: FAD-dependent oxidoreductase [Elusimicrobia bacterium]|nr:FAD-dependent oxidoreductase [Elusimicrobiota bacterium]
MSGHHHAAPHRTRPRHRTRDGGLNQISQAMARGGGEEGGKIRLSTPVRQLTLEGRRVTGVELENGERATADEVIINGFRPRHVPPAAGRNA